MYKWLVCEGPEVISLLDLTNEPDGRWNLVGKDKAWSIFWDSTFGESRLCSGVRMGISVRVEGKAEGNNGSRSSALSFLI